jgi:hypothetical protein
MTITKWTDIVTDGPSVTIDKSHGSPFDRGNADFWYRRQPEPHFWPEGTYHGVKVTEDRMSAVEIAAYLAGYAEAEDQGDQKDYT